MEVGKLDPPPEQVLRTIALNFKERSCRPIIIKLQLSMMILGQALQKKE